MTSCVRCCACHAVLLLPAGPPVLDGYYAARAVEWVNSHQPCKTKP